jgi:hypothetical protein
MPANGHIFSMDMMPGLHPIGQDVRKQGNIQSEIDANK